jgi:tetrathionate reductase subunit B
MLPMIGHRSQSRNRIPMINNGLKEPRCADACPTLAIRFMDETEAKQLIFKSEVWKPELKNKLRPRVYYLNLPRKFIAGTVYDPLEKEVIIEAACTLKETPGGKKYTVKTDSSGDFWFEGLKDGKFNLEIKKGKKVKFFSNLNTSEKDNNLQDIPLT